MNKFQRGYVGFSTTLAIGLLLAYIYFMILNVRTGP